MNKRVRQVISVVLSGMLLSSVWGYSPVLANEGLFPDAEETVLHEDTDAGVLTAPEPDGEIPAGEDPSSPGGDAAPALHIEQEQEEDAPSNEEATAGETEEAPDLFAEGYAAVEEGTVIYDISDTVYEEKGSFGEKAVVYAELYEQADLPEEDWFRISYAAEEEGTGETVLCSAFVRRGSFSELSQEELDRYFDGLDDEETAVIAEYDGHYLRKTSVIPNEEAEIPDDPEKETPEDTRLSSQKASAGAIRISGQPSDQTVKAGGTVTFHVEASGSGLTYQWQTKLNESADWGNTGLGGNKTDTLSFKAPSAYDGRQYRCVVSDSAGSTATSEAAVLTIARITVTGEPEDQAVLPGKKATFHVEAGGADLSYQWQTKLNESADWGNTGLNGSKTDTLSFNAPSSYNGRQYRCVITDSYGNRVLSRAAELSVSSLKITSQPEDIAVGAGNTAAFHVEAVGNGLTYQWQTKLNESADWGNTGLGGNKTDTLSFTAWSAYNGRQYRCVVTDASGKTVTSDAAVLSVGSLKIVSQPEDQTVRAGKAVIFHVEASGSGLKYQWQTKTGESAAWGNTGLNGNKTDTLSFTAYSAYDGRQYRCIITDESGVSVTSNAAVLTIAKLEIISQPEDCASVAGKAASFHVEASGTSLKYQWQTKISESADWGNTGLNGNKTDTLSFNAPSAYNGRQYRCVITDGSGTSVTSEPATLTVLLTRITEQPEDQAVVAGHTAQFHIAASGVGLSYQWQTKLNESADWGNTGLGGNKTATLSFTAPLYYNGRQYRCVVKDKSGNTVISEAATLTVSQGPMTVNKVVYELIDGKMCVVGYEENDTSYVVEGEVDGYTVTVIAEGAFENNTNLESIDLPDSIETIGKRAFAGCVNLSSMN